jgi:hypothetical protein
MLSCTAGVAKLADAPGLGPGPERGGGSSPLARTAGASSRWAPTFGLYAWCARSVPSASPLACRTCLSLSPHILS